jgi:zinc protease
MFPIKTTDIKKVRLNNGLTVMSLEYHKLPLVHITVMVKKGSEKDPPGREGLADLTAEMVTLGTRMRNSQQLALETEQLGAQYSASSGWDASYVQIVGLSETFPTLMELLGDMLLEPTFPPDEMQQSGLSTGDPRSFYRRHYTPDETVLLVIGDLSPEEIAARAEDIFGGWKAQGRSVEQVSGLTRPAGRKIIAVNRPDITQSQIRVGLLGITRKDRDYIPFQVMNYIFGGGGFSSRLMQRIRAEKGYTYGITSTFQAGLIAGPLITSTFTPTATTVPVIEEITTVMEEFITEGARSQELEEAKQFLRGSFPLRLETLGQMVGEILKLELYDIPFDYLCSYAEGVGKVTLAQVNNLASTYLLPEALTCVVVGRTEEFVERFRNWGVVEVVEYSEMAKGCAPFNTSTQASTTCES